MAHFFSWVQAATEKRLTARLERIARQKAQGKKKRTLKGELLSWLDAILFAVIVVLLINQYLFQLFMIPSPSMIETLLIGDRVFVSKTSYGIETYPGGPKILDKKTPLRDDIIVFYNPQYESRGPFFDVLTQIVYMATFSLVNLDVDEEGNMRERLYVKRAAALGGDTVRFSEGTALISGGGVGYFTRDPEFRAQNGLASAPHQTLDASLYPGIRSYGALLAYEESGLAGAAPQHLVQSYQKIANYRGLLDYYEVEANRTRTLHQLDPSNISARSDAAHYRQGIYVPHGYVLPLGDNRDNSQDGRYFGPVSHDVVIGRVLFRFWPFNRMGVVN